MKSEIEQTLEHKLNCLDGEITNIQGNLDSLESGGICVVKMTQDLNRLKNEYDFINTIKQAFEDMEEANALLKRDLDTRNLMRKLTVDKVQSKLDKVQVKLDKIEDVVNNIFKEYTQSNGKYSFSGNDLLEIKSILDKEEETK